MCVHLVVVPSGCSVSGRAGLTDLMLYFYITMFLWFHIYLFFVFLCIAVFLLLFFYFFCWSRQNNICDFFFKFLFKSLANFISTSSPNFAHVTASSRWETTLKPCCFSLGKTLWLRCRVRQRHPLRRHHYRPSSKSDCLLFIRNVDADFFFTLEIPRNVTCLANLWESGTDIPKASIHPYHFAEYFLKLAWRDVVPAGRESLVIFH